MSTELTVWGHACVRLESSSGRRLVIDPGAYSDRAVLADADAVLVTHEHGDHVVPGELRDAVENSSHLEVWAPQSVIDQIAVDPLVAVRVHRVRSGDRFAAAGFRVLALVASPAPARSAPGHPEPRPGQAPEEPDLPIRRSNFDRRRTAAHAEGARTRHSSGPFALCRSGRQRRAARKWRYAPHPRAAPPPRHRHSRPALDRVDGA